MKHLRGSTQATIQPLAIILTTGLWTLISTNIYDGHQEYCGPHTASSVFLILILHIHGHLTRKMNADLQYIQKYVRIAGGKKQLRFALSPCLSVPLPPLHPPPTHPHIPGSRPICHVYMSGVLLPLQVYLMIKCLFISILCLQHLLTSYLG